MLPFQNKQGRLGKVMSKVESQENQALVEHRRRLREHLFKMVFLLEFNPEEEIPDQIKMYLEDPVNLKDEESSEELADEDKYFLTERFEAIKSNLTEIDKKLNEASRGWKTKRMGKVDLAILRLGVYEICYDERIPEAVAINEAVELAKRFGENESSSFINGVLGYVTKK